MQQLGSVVPDFTLIEADGTQVSLSAYRGRKVVLYFYPKDMTASCTKEACDFRDAFPAFGQLDAVVIGVSPDSIKSHQKFKDKQELPFLLVSDPDHTAAELFGVWQLKKMYGREYMGIVRSTFVIDEEGTLVSEWRNLKVAGHVEAVLDKVKELGR